MKHLLNNLSEEEKNRIREQHEGGMKVNTERFKSLLESKLGNAKPLISEDFNVGDDVFVDEMKGEIVDINYEKATAKVRTMFGIEYYPLYKLEKVGGDYSEKYLN